MLQYVSGVPSIAAAAPAAFYNNNQNFKTT